MYNETKIGKMLATDADAAYAALMTLLKRAHGNTVHAALIAGVHHSTLKRWIVRLESMGFVVRTTLSSMRKTMPGKTLTSRRRDWLVAEAIAAREGASLRRAVKRLNAAQRRRVALVAGVQDDAVDCWLAGERPRGTAAIDAVAVRVRARQRRQYRQWPSTQAKRVG